MLTDPTRAFVTDLVGRDLADAGLWTEALTHGSTGEARDYERLEFLGDRVLGLVIAEWLHERGTGDEGKLSQRLNALVSRATCAAIARAQGLGAHLRLGKQARDDGGQDSDNILGDVMEALIGACFVEGGYEAARADVALACELFPQAVVAGDDWDWDSVRQAVADEARQRGRRIVVLGVSWRLTDGGF